MRIGAHSASRLAYPSTLGMLALALSFPIALMVFNPTLMFERGWEQYVGTGIYLWAVFTLGRELRAIRFNDRAFDDAPALLTRLSAPTKSSEDLKDPRILPARIAQLAAYLGGSRTPSVGQLMEINREGSALDQEHAAGRFTLTRYILYLLPVIGFIGTVEGISKALMNISRVLPMVKNLDGFMSNLTTVTSALQVAFDSTLLALFLSAALMLVQTLVYRRSEDLLARIDRWVVGNVLPKLGADESLLAQAGPAEQLEHVRKELAAVLDKLTSAVDRMPVALAGFERGATAIGKIGSDLEAIGTASQSLNRGVASLGRIETVISAPNPTNDHLLDIQRGIEGNRVAVETLASSLAHVYERSNRASQEQLARTMHSLKDALDLLNVSMEQGNSLYRSIVKQMFRTDGNSKGFTVTTEDAA